MIFILTIYLLGAWRKGTGPWKAALVYKSYKLISVNEVQEITWSVHTPCRKQYRCFQICRWQVPRQQRILESLLNMLSNSWIMELGSLNKGVLKAPSPCPGSSLSIKVHSRNSNPDKASEERLLHVWILLKGHILNDWRQLVMITDHNPAFQSAKTILRVLEMKSEEMTKYSD